MQLNDDGVTYRRFRVGPRRLLRFEEIEGLEGAALRLSGGGSLEVPPELRGVLAAILAGPALGASLAETGRAFGHFLRRPFSPRHAARSLLDLAAGLRATDIHLEPGAAGAELRLRVVGELQPFCELASATARRLVAALKGLAACLPYRQDLVQEGRIPREGVGADIRASFVPTTFGERVALRLFGRLVPLDQLSLQPEAQAAWEALLAEESGLVLVAGSTGAGKTTTLYASLAHLARQQRGAVLSLEDPVEQRLRLAGFAVDQVELAPERGLTGEALLAAALRQDVDVLGVGEIRTPAEARLAVEAAATGRLVIAGIHAGSLEEARQRMIDLGVEGPRLGASLRGVIHQSLRTVACGCAPSPAGCPACGGLFKRRSPFATVAPAARLWREAA